MSGTRSPFPKAPATEAIIVAHGQPSDPGPAEAEIAELAQKVATLVPGCRVRGATLAAPGALADALAACATPPVIYPLFMSDGWFTAQALPKRLNGSVRRILPPLGRDPALANLAARAISRRAAVLAWPLHRVTLVIAAHGSTRSRNAAAATEAFAQRLARLVPLRALRIGFVEETPSIAEAATGAGTRSFCLPFFAASGGHVQLDIPMALSQAGFAGATLAPIGLHAGIPALIAGTIAKLRPGICVSEATRRLERAPSPRRGQDLPSIAGPAG